MRISSLPGYGQRSGSLVDFNNDSLTAYNTYVDSQRDGNRILGDLSLYQAWAQGCEVARMSRQTHIILASLLATVIFFTIPPRKKAAPDKQTDGPVSQKTTPTPVNNTNHTAPNLQPNETETEETT